MDGVVITFDIGTQSLRCMVVDKKGALLAMEQKFYEEPYYSLNAGWAEQVPNFYFEHLCEMSKLMSEKHKDLYERAIAVSMTTVRDTVFCIDKDKKPVRDAILWLDKREAKSLKPIPFFRKLAFSSVNMLETIEMQQRMSACNWIMENEAENWAKTDKFILLPTYINYLLTGNLKDSIANMIGHIPVDYKRRRWLKDGGLTRCIADIPKEKLIETCESGEIIGTITKEASELSGLPEGLPLVATGSDKSCETLGLSVINQNQAALSFGTTATIQTTSKKYFEPTPFAPAYPSVMKGHYNIEVQIYRGYWMLTWFKKEFAKKECEIAEKLGVSAEEVLNSRLCEIPAGCDGLVLQPYWSPGVVTPGVKGAIIGFSDIHTRMHMYRAIIEGIGFGLMEGMYNMEKRSKTKFREIFVGGGGSQSPEICQITANMFGLPVKRVHVHEACGIGSSIIAFMALGEFKSYAEAVEHMCHERDTFYPDMEEHKIYQGIYKNVYCKMIKKLEPFYRKTKKILKKD